NGDSLRITNVQFQLPSMIAAAFRTPELQRAQFGDAALERDRHDLAVAAAVFLVERDFERSEFLEIVAPVLDERSRWVILTNGRREESELRWLANCEAELAPGDRRVSSFLHPE